MTLILTYLTPIGIVMGADSTITTRPCNNPPYVTPNMARKIFRAERLGAGVSAWGRWDIDNRLLHDWLPDFIHKDTSVSIAAFANNLADKINTALGRNTTGRGRLGFHVTGYEDFQGTRVPTFFHVHDSETQGNAVVPARPVREWVEAVHDYPPALLAEEFTNNHLVILRNGDYQNYAAIYSALENALQRLAQATGLRIPHVVGIESYEAFVVFQIQMMADLYRLSNILPGIGGRIDSLIIDSQSIREVRSTNPAAAPPNGP